MTSRTLKIPVVPAYKELWSLSDIQTNSRAKEEIYHKDAVLTSKKFL